MAHKTAFRAREDFPSHRHILNIESTLAASVTAPPCLRIFQDLSTAYYCFVGQHIDECTPRSIGYEFSIIRFVNHTCDIQILDCNQSIRLGYPVTEFVQEIIPLVSNFKMQFCQSKLCFSSVSRSFDFSTQSPLQEFQSFFRFDQIFRIINNYSICSIAEIAEVILAVDINPHRILRERMNTFAVWQFTSKDSEPLPRFILFDSQSLDFAFWNTMQDHRNITNLAQLQHFVRDQFKTALGECDAIDSGLKARKSFIFAGRIFDSAKEISKCLMYPVRNILLGLGMNFRIFASKIFIKVKPADRYFTKFISIYAQSKKLIVDYLADFKRINYSFFLLARRIESVFIHPELHSEVEICQII